MEPSPAPRESGLAPIVGWTEPSPVGSPLSDKRAGSPARVPPPVSPAPSTASSGIGQDAPDKSTSASVSAYSPTISSIGDEPTFPSSPNLLDDRLNEDDPEYRPDLDDNKNIVNGKIPEPDEKSLVPILINRKNRISPPTSLTYVTENPTYEGVKFVGIPDKDSICSTSSYGDESDEEDEDEGQPKIPDGGWGWVVVFSSMILSMIADGISFSFGLLYIEFLEHFGESKSKTAWIGSLFMSVPLMSGPVMSALVDNFGCRKMTMLGGVISCAGFVMAAFCNSVEMLFLTFGTIAGLGLGMCYVTAVVSIAYWFDKKRTLAVGLGACGTGIGTFVYAPMTQYFIQEYGWRGTILLLAGTFFNMCVCGAVMREPEWWIKEQKKQAALNNKSIRGASSCGSVSRLSAGVESTFPGVEELRSLMKSGETPEYILTTLATTIAVGEKLEGTIQNEKPQKQLYNSVVNLPTFVRQSEKVPLEVLEALNKNKKVYNVILENYPSLLTCRSSSEKKLNKMPADSPIARVPVTMSMKLKASKKAPKMAEGQPTSFDTNTDVVNSPLLQFADATKEIIVKSPILKSPILKSPAKTQGPWLRRQFSTNQHYLRDIKMHRNSVMYRGAMMNISKYRLRASSCPNIYRNSMIHIAHEEEEKWYDDAVNLIKSMFDFKMFLELHFLLMSLGTILLFTWFIVPYFYLAEHMTRSGYSDDQAAFQLSIIGITNTIGMVGLGWAGDQPWMNVTKTYAVCLFFCGISTLMYPLVTDTYWLLMLTSALFGLFFASSFSFTPVILVELIPLERFTTAYGLILLCQGIGNLLGPPLAGYIFDITQSWDLSFYLAGVWIIISGILVGIIPYTRNFRILGSAPLEKDMEKISQLSQLSQRGSISIA